MRTEPNYDAHITQEPKEAKVVGYCEDCCRRIHEGYMYECDCGEKIHGRCRVVCMNPGCVVNGCFKCIAHLNKDGERICEDCHNNLIKERKNLIESVMAAVEPALSKLGYWYTNPQKLDGVTILEYIKPGNEIHVHIGKEITE